MVLVGGLGADGRLGIERVVSLDLGHPGQGELDELAVLNLVSNAFKYTLEGEIRVSLRAQDGSAVLSVADTGTGIPEAELPNLFNRFHRVEGARGRTQEGTGIGLALVQELARLHGGSVGVQSKLDQGSTFTVTVPLGSRHLPADRIGGTRTLASTALGAHPFVEEALRWLPEAEAATSSATPQSSPRREEESRFHFLGRRGRQWSPSPTLGSALIPKRSRGCSFPSRKRTAAPTEAVAVWGLGWQS